MARAIERLIDAMDALDAPAADLEPSLGAPERHPSSFGFGGFSYVTRFGVDQTQWADGHGDSEEEDQNAEDASGGDVHDEPHDEDADLELELDLELDDDAELDGPAPASDAAQFTEDSCIIAGPDGEAYLDPTTSLLGRLDETIERTLLLKAGADMLAERGAL